MTTHYILIEKQSPHSAHPTVYVKEAAFFISQGGLTTNWGKNWIGINAESIDDARQKGKEIWINQS